MAGRLANKIAVCTASAAGIGEATALAFAAEGAHVIATDIDDQGLERLKKAQPKIDSRHLDVRDPKAIKNLAAEIGNIDILFNCAGFVHHNTILTCTDDEWDFAFDLNLRSMYWMIRAFLPTMVDKSQGSIINMASVASSIRGAPFRFVYGTTKAAVIGLTKSVAADFIKQGVRCNCICPGTVQSPSLDNRINAFADPVQARKDFIARQPMGRLGKASEVAAMAVYLASDDSAFTTGTTMIIDGGWSL